MYLRHYLRNIEVWVRGTACESAGKVENKSKILRQEKPQLKGYLPTDFPAVYKMKTAAKSSVVLVVNFP